MQPSDSYLESPELLLEVDFVWFVELDRKLKLGRQAVLLDELPPTGSNPVVCVKPVSSLNSNTTCWF